MLRCILTVVALGVLGLSIVGCHAAADVNPNGATQVVPGR